MGGSRLGWIGWAIAPWATALVVLVSITARAGEDVGIDYSSTASIALSAATKTVGAGPPGGSRADAGFAGSLAAERRPDLSDGHVANAGSMGLDADGDPVAIDDGATPMIDEAIAGTMMAPGAAEDKLIVLAPPPTTPAVAALAPGQDQPNYAALIPPADSVRQMRCLAEAIYFESRSEPLEGQAAVGQVVLNRVRSGYYPADVCGVVYQDRERPFACQFSFACEGKALRIDEPGPWAVAMRIAKEVVNGERYDPKLTYALNYHANYVYPFWAPMLTRLEKIGNHIFYAMRPGVVWAPGAVVAKADTAPAK